MSREALRAALESELRAFSTPRALPVAGENRTFHPNGHHPYLETSIIVSDEGAAALGENAASKIDGFMQVDVVTEAGKGPGEADRIKDALNMHFGRRRIEGDGVTIIVSGVRTAPSGYARTAEYILPVDIRFTAYATFQRG